MSFIIVFNRYFLAAANGFIYFGFRGFGREGSGGRGWCCGGRDEKEIDLYTVWCAHAEHDTLRADRSSTPLSSLAHLSPSPISRSLHFLRPYTPWRRFLCRASTLKPPHRVWMIYRRPAFAYIPVKLLTCQSISPPPTPLHFYHHTTALVRTSGRLDRTATSAVRGHFRCSKSAKTRRPTTVLQVLYRIRFCCCCCLLLLID